MFVKLKKSFEKYAKNAKDLDEKGGMGRLKPIGKLFRETRGRTENRGLRRIEKQKATDDRWLFYDIRGSKLLPSWNKTGEIVGKGGAFCRGRRVTGSANFIGYTGPKRPLRTSL